MEDSRSTLTWNLDLRRLGLQILDACQRDENVINWMKKTTRWKVKCKTNHTSSLDLVTTSIAFLDNYENWLLHPGQRFFSRVIQIRHIHSNGNHKSEIIVLFGLEDMLPSAHANDWEISHHVHLSRKWNRYIYCVPTESDPWRSISIKCILVFARRVVLELPAAHNMQDCREVHNIARIKTDLYGK